MDKSFKPLLLYLLALGVTASGSPPPPESRHLISVSQPPQIPSQSSPSTKLLPQQEQHPHPNNEYPPSYTSGRTLDHSEMPDYDLIERPTTRPGSFLTGLQALVPNFGDWFHSGVDMKSALMGAMLGAGATMYTQGGKWAAGLLPAVRDAVVDFRKSANSTSQRKRRDVEFDTDLTELAGMVLSAIQSGECMQRSICLMGSQLGSTPKGKIGFILVDKLIPEGVQDSQYFLTLKKALLHSGNGSYCDRFRCRV